MRNKNRCYYIFISALVVISFLITPRPASSQSGVLVYNEPAYVNITRDSNGVAWAYWSCSAGIMRRSITNGSMGQIESVEPRAVRVQIKAVGNTVFWLEIYNSKWLVKGYSVSSHLTYQGKTTYSGTRGYISAVDIPAYSRYAVVLGTESAGGPVVELYSYASSSPLATISVSQRSWAKVTGISVATDGANFIVVYAASPDGIQSDVYVRTFNADGAPLGDEIPVSSTRYDETDPVVINEGLGGYIISYSYFVSSNLSALPQSTATKTPTATLASTTVKKTGLTQVTPALTSTTGDKPQGTVFENTQTPTTLAAKKVLPVPVHLTDSGISQLIVSLHGLDGAKTSSYLVSDSTSGNIEYPSMSYDPVTKEVLLTWFTRSLGMDRITSATGTVHSMSLVNGNPANTVSSVGTAYNNVLASGIVAAPYAAYSYSGKNSVVLSGESSLSGSFQNTYSATPVPTVTPTPTLPSSPQSTPTLAVIGDVYEYDDSYPSLPVGVDIRRSFNPQGDMDKGRFAVKSGYTYRVYTNSSAPVDPKMALWLETTGIRLEDEDSFDGRNPEITFVAVKSDTAFLELTSNNNQYGYESTYSLFIAETMPSIQIPTPSGDAFEPDNTQVQAKEILIGESQSRTISSSDDKDNIKVYLRGGTQYSILAQRASGSLVDLFLTNYTEGLQNDQCPSYSGQQAACLVFTASATGFHMLEILAISGNGAYRLSVIQALPTVTPIMPSRTPTMTLAPTVARSATPIPVDNYEPDDTRAYAKQLVQGETQSRTFYLSVGGKDVDWVKLVLKPGIWRIAAITTTGIYDPQIKLYSDSTVVAGADDTDGKNASIVIPISSTAMYYLMITNVGVDGFGEYKLTLDYVPPTATPLPTVTSVSPSSSGTSATSVVPTSSSSWSGGGSGGGSNSYPTAMKTPTPNGTPGTLTPLVRKGIAEIPANYVSGRVKVIVYVDVNGDGMLSTGEGIDNILITAKSSFQGILDTRYTKSGEALIEYSLPDKSDLVIDAPYLRSSEKLTVNKLAASSDLKAEFKLTMPKYPQLLP
ncbi:MAG: hypothetical protein AB9888_00165 [Bacteroidales bacterium]